MDGDLIEVELLYYENLNETIANIRLPMWIIFDGKYLTAKGTSSIIATNKFQLRINDGLGGYAS
jgi:hypothetical protein